MPKVSTPLRPQWTAIPQPAFRNKFQQLRTIQDLAAFWGIEPYQISYYAYHVDRRLVYETFLMPRRNRSRGERKIEAPTPTLKYIQRLIHESLTRMYGPHQAVHGFRTGRSIVTNATRHLGRRYVLNIDLEDFFPSITGKRIYWRLVAAPYSLTQESGAFDRRPVH